MLGKSGLMREIFITSSTKLISDCGSRADDVLALSATGACVIMNGDCHIIPGNLVLKFREAGAVPGRNKLVKFRETCALKLMCATAAAGALIVAAAVALCVPCILAVAEDDRISNEIEGFDGNIISRG